MKAVGRVEKVEATLYAERARGAVCAFHALADITPTPRGAEVWEGACAECDAAIIYHSTGPMPSRERDLYRELYAVGRTPARVTGSRRMLAVTVWMSRQPPASSPPLGPYEQVLSDESLRRIRERWTEHWKTVPDDVLEDAADMFEGRVSDAELEAIIWPGEARRA